MDKHRGHSSHHSHTVEGKVQVGDGKAVGRIHQEDTRGPADRTLEVEVDCCQQAVAGE